MTNEQRSFKEVVNQIDVPVDKLDAIIEKTVNEAHPVTRKSKKHVLLYSASAAVVAFGLLIGSASVSPAMANVVSQIPLIGSIFNNLGDDGLKQVSEQGLSQPVGQSDSSQGTTLTIDEVFYDGTRFSIGYIAESDLPIEDHSIGLETIKIDGQSPPNILSSMTQFDRLNPRQHSGVIELDLPGNTLPDTGQFTLDLSFAGNKGEQWNFSFPVTLQNDVKITTIDEQQEAAGFELVVKTIEAGPGGTAIHYDLISDTEDTLFSLLDFKIVDHTGKELSPISSGGGSAKITEEGTVFTGKSLFDPIDDGVNELTITPYIQEASIVTSTVSGDVEKSVVTTNEDDDLDKTVYQQQPVTFESFKVKLP